MGAIVAVVIGVLVALAVASHQSRADVVPDPRTPSAGASAGASVHATPAAPQQPATLEPSVRATAAQGRRLSVVALGDSVPSGYACDCRTYVDLVADGLRHDGDTVDVHNLSAPGLTAAQLASQLSTSRSLQQAVTDADVVLVQVGANDLGPTRDTLDDDECPGGGTGCYAEALRDMRLALDHVLRDVRTLRSGPPATVLVVDYWAVFQDGEVLRGQTGASGRQTDDAVTLAANGQLCGAARAVGATCVDIRPAFRDVDGSRDATPLLAPDGDHPNAAGHRAIAAVVLSSLRPLLALQCPGRPPGSDGAARVGQSGWRDRR